MTATTRLKKSKKSGSRRAAKKSNGRKSNGRKSTTRKTSGKSGTRKRASRAATAAGQKDRFEARRRAAERSQGLKRFRLVLGLAVVSSMAIATIGFLNSPWFDVDEITVIGSQRSDPDLVIEESGIELGQALLEVDLTTAAAAVQLVPWVGGVTVDRAWTGSITITVTERGPSVVLPAGDRFALVDDHGRQLEIVDSRPDGFIPVRGIEGSGVAGEPAPTEALTLISLLEALPPEVEQQVRAVAVEGGELFLELTVGGRANFGDGSELGLKLQALETMLGAVDLRCLHTIDVRVPSAPALTRTGTDPGDETGPPTEAEDDSSGDATAESNAGEEPDSAAPDC